MRATARLQEGPRQLRWRPPLEQRYFAIGSGLLRTELHSLQLDSLTPRTWNVAVERGLYHGN